MSDWKTKLENELQLAADARARNNEGRARVCARRAAGIAVREYLARRSIKTGSPSAYDLLKTLAGMPDIPAGARSASQYLTLRVDEEFKLPAAVDLIHEARALCEQLLPGELT